MSKNKAKINLDIENPGLFQIVQDQETGDSTPIEFVEIKVSKAIDKAAETLGIEITNKLADRIIKNVSILINDLIKNSKQADLYDTIAHMVFIFDYCEYITEWVSDLED